MVVIERFRKNGERYVPHRYEDGRFRVANPSLGGDMKLERNQSPVSIIEELIDYIRRRRFYTRMRGENTGQCSLISPGAIAIR